MTSFIIHADIEYYFMCTWCYDATFRSLFLFFFPCCRMHFGIDLHCSICRPNQRWYHEWDCPIGMQIPMFSLSSFHCMWSNIEMSDGKLEVVTTLQHVDPVEMQLKWKRVKEARLCQATSYETSKQMWEIGIHIWASTWLIILLIMLQWWRGRENKRERMLRGGG